MIPPRNMQDQPIAVEERMGSGVRDPRVHHSMSSLKDERESVQDPPIDVPQDEITELMDQRLPQPQKMQVIDGVIVDANMSGDGAHVEVSDGNRSVCVFIQGTVIIEKMMSVVVIAHMDPRHPGVVQRVTLAPSDSKKNRVGGNRDEDLPSR